VDKKVSYLNAHSHILVDFMKIISVFLALALLCSTLSAYCVCIRGERCGCSDDSYYDGRENTTVYINEEDAKKSDKFTYASDRPIDDGQDTFALSRGEFYQYEQKINIHISSACEGENLIASLTYNNKPLAGAKLILYSHTGGRNYASEVQANSDGIAIFAPKDAGAYDFIAQKEGYASNQLIFKIKECFAQSNKQTAQSTSSNANDLGSNSNNFAASQGSPSATSSNSQGNSLTTSGPQNNGITNDITILYFGNYKRVFEKTILPGGSTATKVEIIFPPATQTQISNSTYSNSSATYYLVEKVPKSQAASSLAIGFEGTYPAKTAEDENNILIYWEIGNNFEKSFSRTYILLKNQNPDFAAFSRPSFEPKEGVAPQPQQAGFDFWALAFPALIILIAAAAIIFALSRALA
jgi:hypothetical protein